MSINSSSQKKINKQNTFSPKPNTSMGLKKMQTFNQKYDHSNDILAQSIKTVMNDKRRICEKEKSGYSLGIFSNTLASHSDCNHHTHSQHLAFNTITNDFTFGPTYEDIKLEFTEGISNCKETDKKYQFNIDHNLMCMICKKIMDDPCKCYKCSTCYCRKCIEKVISKTIKCPQCFNIIGKGSLLPIDMTMIYSSTIIPCPIPGCKDSFNLLEISHHMSECPFQEAKETQRLNVHKILPNSNEEDSYIKLHLLSYLKEINTMEMKLAQSYVLTPEEHKKKESELGAPGHEKSQKQENDLLTLKININHFNNVMEKSLIDISNATKRTNDSIKRILNKLPK